jgi:hypothetical protein
VRTFDIDVEWGKISFLHQLFTDDILRVRHLLAAEAALRTREKGLCLQSSVVKCVTFCQVSPQGRNKWSV